VHAVWLIIKTGRKKEKIFLALYIHPATLLTW